MRQWKGIVRNMVAAAALTLPTAVRAQDAKVVTSVTYQGAPGEAPPWLPYDDKATGILFFRGTAAGQPVDGVVDTGVTFTTLDAGFARGIAPDLPVARSIELNAVGGRAQAGLGPVVDLHAAGYSATNLQTLVADLSGLAHTAGRPIGVMVGLNVLGWGAIDLDLGEKRWRLGSSGTVLPEAHRVPLRYTEDHYYSFVTIAVAGRTLRLFVDTGYDGGLMLTGAALQATKLAAEALPTTIAVNGLGGTKILPMLVPRQIRFGSETLSDVPVEIDEGDGLPAKLGLDGMIGTALLGKLHVVLDYPAGIMSYRASTRPSESAEKTTIGLQAIPADDRLTVAHAMAHSPAAIKGWKSGDTICAVNGVKISPQQEGKWNFSPAGTRVRFLMCDGSSRILLSRNFY